MKYYTSVQAFSLHCFSAVKPKSRVKILQTKHIFAHWPVLLSAFDIVLVPCVLVLIVCVCGFCNSFQLGDHLVEEVSTSRFI